ncbi:MAG TPA: sigma-70 family RNA polymerase sigma factor [Verrucomicrobiae bacterium]|nr:sigma-70 family RNA polymerase sigma factor [Verrucomicrobiae bacterium]
MDSGHQPPFNNPGFSATRWTLIYAARNDSPEALAALYTRYWGPLYAYIRRSGSSKEEAEDLVQGFFCELLAGDFLKKVTPEKGKFRSFLLACYKNYASNVRKRASAIKRGGGAPILPMEAEGLEGTYTIEPVDHLTPEKLYLRRWALAVIENVLAEVAAEYEGRSEMFRVIEPFLRKENECRYREAAEQLGMSENAFKQAVFRLREFYKSRFRLAVAQTLAPNENVDQEIQELLTAIS